MTITIITWHDVSTVRPDADETVLIFNPDMDPTVWLGYLDGEQWRSIEGQPMPAPTRWATMPDEPAQSGVSAPAAGVPAILPKLTEGQLWCCSKGCGECRPEQYEFETFRSEDLQGNLLERRTEPACRSHCCKADLMLWDEGKQDFVDWAYVAAPAANAQPSELPLNDGDQCERCGKPDFMSCGCTPAQQLAAAGCTHNMQPDATSGIQFCTRCGMSDVQVRRQERAALAQAQSDSAGDARPARLTAAQLHALKQYAEGAEHPEMDERAGRLAFHAREKVIGALERKGLICEGEITAAGLAAIAASAATKGEQK